MFCSNWNTVLYITHCGSWRNSFLVSQTQVNTGERIYCKHDLQPATSAERDIQPLCVASHLCMCKICHVYTNIMYREVNRYFPYFCLSINSWKNRQKNCEREKFLIVPRGLIILPLPSVWPAVTFDGQHNFCSFSNTKASATEYKMYEGCC